MPAPRRSPIVIALLAIVLVAALPACSTPPQSASVHSMALDQMPPEVQSAPRSVQTAYQFAADNPDVMKGVPCYCGCGSIGHTSNYACYVSQVDSAGTITFDRHAQGCSLCVDITQDTIRLLGQGKSVPQIKAYVDSTYSKYGTSNMP
jgi:hypothetical protein